MSIYECTITNPKKQLEFYKDLSEQLQQENQKLKKQLEVGEDQYNDLVEEKEEIKNINDKLSSALNSAENKIDKMKKQIQELEEQLKIKHNGFMASVDESCDLAKENQKYKEVIDKAIEWIKKRINSCTIEAESTTNDTMCKITISGLYNLLNILEEVG